MMSTTDKILPIGPYNFVLPVSWTLSVELAKYHENIPNQEIHTFWKINTGRFYFSIHLSTQNLDDLAKFIGHSTKQINVTTPSIKIGDLEGVTYGGSDRPSTWIDWWFKENDTMVCINLRSNDFPFTEPTQVEIDAHNAFISSIKYTLAKVTNVEE